jgi:hypothetical protein
MYTAVRVPLTTKSATLIGLSPSLGRDSRQAFVDSMHRFRELARSVDGQSLLLDDPMQQLQAPQDHHIARLALRPQALVVRHTGPAITFGKQQTNPILKLKRALSCQLRRSGEASEIRSDHSDAQRLRRHSIQLIHSDW